MKKCKKDGTCVNDDTEFTLAYPPLKPGQVEPITLEETGEEIMSYGHRVGLPPNLTQDLLAFSDRIGITQEMRRLVLEGNELEIGGEKRVTLNGGVWWIKRFTSEWHSNMHYITPDDDKANLDFLTALGEAGFDTVLDGVGDYFELDGLMCYYISFIAVSYCDGSYLHADAEGSNGKNFNMLFPVMQTEDPGPELDIEADDGSLVIGYKYEKDHAILLGDDGFHGTAHVDYRDTGKMRLSVSVYMADVNKDNLDKIIWDPEDADPKYPDKDRMEQFFLDRAGDDWKKGDPSKHLPTKEQTTLFAEES